MGWDRESIYDVGEHRGGVGVGSRMRLAPDGGEKVIPFWRCVAYERDSQREPKSWQLEGSEMEMPANLGV